MVVEFMIAIVLLLAAVIAGFMLGTYSTLRFIVKKAPEAIPYIDKAFEKE